MNEAQSKNNRIAQSGALFDAVLALNTEGPPDFSAQSFAPAEWDIPALPAALQYFPAPPGKDLSLRKISIDPDEKPRYLRLNPISGGKHQDLSADSKLLPELLTWNGSIRWQTTGNQEENWLKKCFSMQGIQMGTAAKKLQTLSTRPQFLPAFLGDWFRMTDKWWKFGFMHLDWGRMGQQFPRMATHSLIQPQNPFTTALAYQPSDELTERESIEASGGIDE